MSQQVCFYGDGLSLTATETATLLARLASTPPGIDIDSYSRGGVVAELETRVARMLGKESAIFLPTGTMANHLAVRALCEGRGRRILAQADSHLVNDAGDCAQVLSGLNVVPMAPGQPCFSAADVALELERASNSKAAVPVGAVSIESPIRRMDNAAVPMADLVAVTTAARGAGIGLHMDGARLPLYAAHLGVAPADVAALFDTVYVSMWKCFNAPSGAVLAGAADLIDKLYHSRRMMGGSLPAVWPFAAIALHHLDDFEAESISVLAMAEQLFSRLEASGRCQVLRVANGTNVFRLRLAQGDPEQWRTNAQAWGVELPAPDAINGEFICKMNPTWLRSTADDLAQALLESI